jgi:hypothetical protein
MGTKKAFLVSNNSIDPDAQLWFTACSDLVSLERLMIVSELIKNLKAADIWNELDRLWIHAGENATQSLIDIKARSSATAINSPTFTANKGYAGNGTSSYIESNFNASTAGGKYTRLSASMGGWCETYGASGGCLIGNNDSSYSRIILSGATRESSCNTGTSPGSISVASHVGFIMAQRTAEAAHASYYNGVSEQSGTTASTTLNNQNTKILANITGGGVIAKYATHRIALSFLGSGLSGRENSFYTAVRLFMTKIGVA